MSLFQTLAILYGIPVGALIGYTIYWAATSQDGNDPKDWMP